MWFDRPPETYSPDPAYIFYAGSYDTPKVLYAEPKMLFIILPFKNVSVEKTTDRTIRIIHNCWRLKYQKIVVRHIGTAISAERPRTIIAC
jgi:hypothetical protein